LLPLQGLELRELLEALGAETLQLGKVSGELSLLGGQLPLQRADLTDQRSVVQGDQVEVLVAVQQVAEALGAQKDPGGVQGPALVDRA